MTFKKIVLLGLLAATTVPSASMAASRVHEKTALQKIICFVFQAQRMEELTPEECELAENLFAVPGKQIDSFDLLNATVKSLMPWLILVDHSRAG